PDRARARTSAWVSSRWGWIYRNRETRPCHGWRRQAVTEPARWWEGRLVKAALLGIVAVVLGGVVWLRRPAEVTPRPARLAQALVPAPVALAPGVYLLGKNSPAAVYLVETSRGLVLIDSGLDPRAERVLSQLSQLDFDVRQLRAILLTHVHADHST